MPTDRVGDIVRIAQGNWLIVTLPCNELSGHPARDTGRDIPP